MSHYPGFFLAFEGLDGAGKSTQVASLSAELSRRGFSVTTVRPSDTNLGELVRGFILQHHIDTPVDPWSEVLMFVAGRVQLLREVIIPALERGDVVIADRYAHSTLAYQGGGRGLDIAELRRLHRFMCQDLWPDLTLYLDIPLETAKLRQRTQDLPIDRIESAPDSFHANVRATFEALASDPAEHMVRIDASQSASAISQDIAEAVMDALATRQDRVPSSAGAARQ